MGQSFSETNRAYDEFMGPNLHGDQDINHAQSGWFESNESLVPCEGVQKPPEYSSEDEGDRPLPPNAYVTDALRDIGLLPPVVLRKSHLPSLQIPSELDITSRGGHSGPATPLLLLEGPAKQPINEGDVEMGEDQDRTPTMDIGEPPTLFEEGGGLSFSQKVEKNSQTGTISP